MPGAGSTASSPARRSSAPSILSAASRSELGPSVASRAAPASLRSTRSLRPRGEVAPGRARGSARRELRLELGDERLELPARGELPFVPRRSGVAVGHRELLGELVLERANVALELPVPVRRAAHDPGAATDALPARRRHFAAVAPVDRCRREQHHHVVAVEVAVGQREQREQRRAEHALAERADRSTVVRDARGVELLVHEAGVGLRGAEEHRHAVEWHAVAQRVDHEPDDGAHLVVGIGGRHHAGAVRRCVRRAPTRRPRHRR